MKKILFLFLASLITATTLNAQNTVRLIRNATLKIQYSGKTILLDPLLGEKGSSVSALKVNKNPRVHLSMPVTEILENLDCVLLTHAHIDHYDDAAKKMISKSMPWYVQPADYDSVAVKDKFIHTTAIVDSLQTGNLTIVRITGSHGRGKLAEMMGASSGYVLKAQGQPTLYIMGDCIWNEATQKAVKQHNPAYIVVNSGGAILPPFSKTDGPIIPNEQEVMAMLDALPEHIKLIAVHMDAIDHCQTTREILRNEARHHGADMSRLIIPKDGEKITL